MNDSCLYEILDYIVGPDVKLDYPPPQPVCISQTWHIRVGIVVLQSLPKLRCQIPEMIEDERDREREGGICK